MLAWLGQARHRSCATVRHRKISVIAETLSYWSNAQVTIVWLHSNHVGGLSLNQQCTGGIQGFARLVSYFSR